MRVTFLSVIFLTSTTLPLMLVIGGSEWIPLEKPATTHKEPSGGCFERMHKLGRLDKDETKRIAGMCMTATCLANGSVKYAGCPLVAIRPPCYAVPGNLSLPHPECCFKIECYEDKKTPGKMAARLMISAMDELDD